MRCEILHKLRLAVIPSNTYVEGLERSRTSPALLVLSMQLGTQAKKNKMGGENYTCCGEERCTRDKVEKPLGKRPLGKPRCRWKDNIKI